MRQHISKLIVLWYYHLRRLKKFRRILGSTITCRLLSAFVSSRLDYCNSILAGLSKSTIVHLQRIQNAAVRLACGLGPRDHMTKSLHELHWLPIRFLIVCKLCLMMYNVYTGCSLCYIKEILTPTAVLPNPSSICPLQSAYRQFHSTETVLLKIASDLFEAAESGCVTVRVAVGLSAAFDTIDHQELVLRLEHTFGVKRPALGWARSYLEGRSCFVKVGNAMSTTLSSDTGIP